MPCQPFKKPTTGPKKGPLRSDYTAKVDVQKRSFAFLLPKCVRVVTVVRGMAIYACEVIILPEKSK